MIRFLTINILFESCRFKGAATRVKLDEMRPSIQRWLRKEISITKCTNLKDFLDFLSKNKLSYHDGTLKSETLID